MVTEYKFGLNFRTFIYKLNKPHKSVKAGNVPDLGSNNEPFCGNQCHYRWFIPQASNF